MPEQFIPKYYSIACNARGKCCLFGWALHTHIGDGLVTRFQDNRVRTPLLIVARFQRGIIADFPTLADFFVACGKAAGGSIAGRVVGSYVGEIVTDFLEPTVVAGRAVLARRVRVAPAVGHLRDKQVVDAALRFSTDRPWDPTDYIPAAAALGISCAVTDGLLGGPRGGGPWTDPRPGGRTYGPCGAVNY